MDALTVDRRPSGQPFQFGLKLLLGIVLVVALLVAPFQFGFRFGASLLWHVAVVTAFVLGVRRARTTRTSTIGWGRACLYSGYWVGAIFPIWFTWTAMAAAAISWRPDVPAPIAVIDFDAMPHLCALIAGSAHGSLKVGFVTLFSFWELVLLSTYLCRQLI